MDELIPATGRVLRYWYGAMAGRARQQLYDYLGVRPIKNTESEGAKASWVASEVWSRPAPGLEQTVKITHAQPHPGIPRLNKRIRVSPTKFAQPTHRRPGAVLTTTFASTRARQRRVSAGKGMSLI